MKKRTIKRRVAAIRDDFSGMCYPRDAEDLLKAERARVRRVVRWVKSHAEISTYGAGYQKACDDILAKLKEGA